MKKIILKNFIGALVFFGTGFLLFFLVKARNGLQVSPGDKLQASKRNELVNQVSTISGQVSTLSGQVTTLSSSSLKLANGSNTKICSGKSSSSAWIKYTDNCSVYVNVDISSCGFSSSPKIFTSLDGQGGSRQTVGSTSIYSTSKTGFTVYVVYIPRMGYSTAGTVGCASSSDLISTIVVPNLRYINRIAIGN